jgi:hypothetical protein
MVEIKHKYKISHYSEVYMLTFIAGKLDRIDFETDLNESNTMLVFTNLYGSETDMIVRLKHLHGAKVKQLKISTQQQKLALWCELYKMTYGLAYKVSKANASHVKNIEFTQKLITKFHKNNEWWAKEKTIARYCNNINLLRRDESKGSKAETKRQSDIENLATAFQQRYKD